MPAYSELSRKQKILWYWRPLSFGFFIGFLFELIRSYFGACASFSTLFFSYRHVSDLFVQSALWRLEKQIVSLAFASNMVNEGIDVAFRVAVVTAFIAFAINQVKREWAEHLDDALTLIFGKTHYSVLGFLTADLAKVCLKVYAGGFVLILAVGLLFALFGGELLY